MQSDDVTLHLIDMTLPFAGVAYLFLAAACGLLALRFRAWLPAVACLGFVYIAVARLAVFAWSWLDRTSPAMPGWLDAFARYPSVALMLAAIALLVFVARSVRPDG